jgi:organic hydroperoxide reductase OsmC/OhrA
MKIKDGKMRIVEVALRPKVIVAPGTDIDRAERLHHLANQECFIANSVNFPVKHYPEVTEG